MHIHMLRAASARPSAMPTTLLTLLYCQWRLLASKCILYSLVSLQRYTTMRHIIRLIILSLVGFPAWAIAQADSAGIAEFQDQMHQMAERLDLTESQRAELEPILQAQFEQTRALLERHGLDRRPASPPGRRQLLALSRDLRPLRERTDRQVEAILSDEQMTEYRDIQRERRDRMRAEFKR